MNKITTNQITAIRTAANKVFGLCRCKNGFLCNYHDWLASNFGGVISTKDLNKQEASEALSLLARETGYEYKQPHWNKRKYFGGGKRGNRRQETGDRRLSQAQASKISGLEKILEWDDKQTRDFIKKQIGVRKAVAWLYKDEANKVIIGMQRIIAEGDKELYRFLNTLTSNDLKKQSVRDILNQIKRKVT